MLVDPILLLSNNAIQPGLLRCLSLSQPRRHFPDASITLIHAPEIPTIGVGEGAGPWFRRWLDDEGITPELMATEANATKKQGICFENWGGHAKQHHHIFTPANTAFSYHFDANKITTLLLRGITVEVIQKRASEALVQKFS